MPRGGRNIPGLKEAWALKGKLMVKKYRGQVIVQGWPKAYGPPRSQAQADTIKAFKQMQRAMKFQQPTEWVDAIESTSKTGMYPRDYLMSCMSGNMFMVEYMPGFAISAAIDMIADFTAVGGETLFLINTIPPGYRALRIIGTGRALNASNFSVVNLTFNADTSASYDWLQWTNFGIGATYAQNAAVIAAFTAANSPANYPGEFEIIIPAYATTSFFKTVRSVAGDLQSITPSGFTLRNIIAYWRKKDAITRIDLTVPGGMVAGTKITCYGMY